jgi:hypothetical protein
MEFNEFGDFIGQMPPILVFNVCMVVFIISALLLYFTLVRPFVKARRPKEVVPTSTVTAPSPAPYIPQRRTGEYTVKLPDGQPARAIEVLSILRDTADDRLIVQMGSTGYRTLIDHPEVKSKFTALMKELAETIARADTPRPMVENIPFTELDIPDDFDLPDLDSLSSIPAPASKPITPAKRTIPTTPPPASGTMPGSLPNYREASEPKVTKKGLFGGPKIEYQPVPELNLAASIEAYLQHRLTHTPEYAQRDIHVHSAPGGGVRIQVDDRYYDAVGDVDDPSIRAFIASTIEEWQEQQ